MTTTTTKGNRTWAERIEPVTGFPKMPALVDALVRLARDLGPGTRLPRTREMAQALGVTVVTLNQGLTQLERRGFLDRRPRSGIYVSPHVAQKNVGLVIGWDIFSGHPEAATFYSLLLACCARRAALKQERFSFFLDTPTPPTSGDRTPGTLVHQDLADALTAGRLDGLLLISPHGPEQENWLKSHGKPVVNLSLTRRPGSVTVDSEGLIRMAAQELMQNGARTLGLITSYAPEVGYFRTAAAALGFEIREQWISHQDTRSPGNLSLSTLGRRAVNALLHSESVVPVSTRADTATLPPPTAPLPDALIIGNDIMAGGAIPALSTAGIQPGREIKLAVHANKGSPVLTPWNHCITRCEIDPQEIADALFSLLEDRMDNAAPSRNAPPPSGDGVWRILPHIVQPESGGVSIS